MSNPFILAIRKNPDQFLGEMESSELRAITEACVEQLVKRAKSGDSTAPSALQAMYRSIANVQS